MILATDVVGVMMEKISERSLEENQDLITGSASDWGQGRFKKSLVHRILCFV